MKRIISFLLVFVLALSCASVASGEEGAKEFALLGTAKYTDKNTDSFGVAVCGDYAYVAGRAGGLRVINIADKTNPADVTPEDDVYMGTTAVDAPQAAYAFDGFLYVCFATKSPQGSAKQGVRKYNLSTPEAPEYVCTYTAYSPVSVLEFAGYIMVADKNFGLKFFKGDSETPSKTFVEPGAANVTDMAVCGDFLYAATSTGTLLVYSVHTPNSPLLFSKRTVAGIKNCTRLVANESGIYITDQGTSKLYIIDLNSIGGDLVYLESAQLITTSLDIANFTVRDIELFGDYIFVSDTSALYIIDAADPKNIKKCKTVSVNLVNFEIADGFVVGTARTNGLNVVSLGDIPEGKEFVPYEVTLEKIKQENLKNESITFGDIKNNSKKSYIEKAADLCIVTGDENGNFNPGKSVTLAEFLTALMRAANINKTDFSGELENVKKEAWYSPFAQAAFDFGIIKADENGFENEITKQKAAELVYAVLEKLSEKELSQSKRRVADLENLDEQTADKIRYLVENKLFLLDKDKNFLPQSVVTRAEMTVPLSQISVWAKQNNVDLTAFRQAPIILRTSDEVETGETFNVFGEGFLTEGAQLFVDYLSTEDMPTEPSKNAAVLDAVYCDENGQFATFVLSKALEPSVYAIYTKNEYGFSKPAVLNGARTLWVSTAEVSAGADALVSGRNFDLLETGGETKTQVKLKNGKDEYFADIRSVDPYAVHFTVSKDVPLGEYTVFVSNDGIYFDESEDGIKLKVKAAAYDPFELGVSWADEFDFKTKVNAKDFGAKGDGSVYDTAAIQAAIDSLPESGGVCYIPEGTYMVESIKLPGYVVLEGAGKDKTILLHKGDTENRTKSEIAADAIIQSDYEKKGTLGRQGIINLTLDVSKDLDPGYAPIRYFWLGNGWNPLSSKTRTADYIFVKNVKIGTRSFEWEQMEGVEGLTDKLRHTNCVIAMNDYLLVDGCDFHGDAAQLTSTYMNRYVWVKNNDINTFYGNNYIHAANTVYENNKITRAHWTIGKDVQASRQGIYMRTNGYMRDNEIINTGCMLGDGEVIATEAYNSGTSMYGNIVSAGARTLKLDPKTNAAGFPLGNSTWSEPYDISKMSYPEWKVVITQGRGLGQSRKIVAADKASRTLTLDKEWDITPDSSSKFTMYMPADNIAMYKNTVSETSWGFLFYGGGMDNVVADNVGYNTTGIDFSAIEKEGYLEDSNVSMDCRVWFHYFDRVEGNSFVGTSWKNGNVSICLNGKYESGDLNGYYFYGTDIKDNFMDGKGSNPESVNKLWNDLVAQGAKSVGYVAENGIHLRFANRAKSTDKTKGTRAVIIENNKMANMDQGIVLGGDAYSVDTDLNYVNNFASANTSGVVISGNTFENVENEIVRYNDTNTIILEKGE